MTALRFLLPTTTSSSTAGVTGLVLLFCYGIAFCVVEVASHGYLHSPVSRNMEAYSAAVAKGDPPSALSQETPPAFFAPDFTNAADSICGGGDKSQDSRLNNEGTGWGRMAPMHPEHDGSLYAGGGEDKLFPGKIGLIPATDSGSYNVAQNQFLEGQQIVAEVIVRTGHWGYFTFHLCDTADIAGDRLTKECFKHTLLRVKLPGDIEDQSPLLENFPERYYFGNFACNKLNSFTTPPAGIQTAFGGVVHKVRLQLPEDLTCSHCVLQWWWHVGSSCTHPEYETERAFQAESISQDGPDYMGVTNCIKPGSAFHSDVVGMPECKLDSKEETLPEAFEQFKSCSDVSIRAGLGDEVDGNDEETTTTTTTAAPPVGSSTSAFISSTSSTHPIMSTKLSYGRQQCIAVCEKKAQFPENCIERCFKEFPIV